MPTYEYRCQKCREVFGVERSMTDTSAASCTACNSEDVSRIWNAVIRTGASAPDVGQGTKSSAPSSGGGGGCGSCSTHSCHSC